MAEKGLGKGFGLRLIMLTICSLLLIPLKVQAEENTGMEPAVVTEDVQAQEATEEGAKEAEATGEAEAAGEVGNAGNAEAAGDTEITETAENAENELLTCLTPEELVLYQQMEDLCGLQREQTMTTQQQIQLLTAQSMTETLDTASGQLLEQLVQLYNSQLAQLTLMQEQLDILLDTASVRQEEASREYGPEIIFVGDSRTVQMHNAVGGDQYVWIAKSSQGYRWFAEEAIPRIDEEVGYGTKILLNLGVNDVANVNSYAELVNRKTEEWMEKGASVYYASVNPVENGEFITKKMVSNFNQKLKAKLDSRIHWIDSNSWLQNTGYTLTDGLHFSNKTSKNLYQYYLSALNVQGAS